MVAVATLAGCSLMAPPRAGQPGETRTGDTTTATTAAGELPAETLRPVNPAAAQFIAAAANWQDIDDGSYTFLVKAANNHGVWGEPARLKIAIAPPFWHTWWFRLLAAATLALLLAATFAWRTRALKARNRAPRDAPLFNDAEALLIRIQKTPL